jgi:hypothetical protein
MRCTELFSGLQSQLLSRPSADGCSATRSRNTNWLDFRRFRRIPVQRLRREPGGIVGKREVDIPLGGLWSNFRKLSLKGGPYLSGSKADETYLYPHMWV